MNLENIHIYSDASRDIVGIHFSVRGAEIRYEESALGRESLTDEEILSLIDKALSGNVEQVIIPLQPMN